MWKIRTHRMGIDQGSQVLFSDFQHDGTMWTGDGERELRKRVAFSEPFVTAPAVKVTMSMWDVDHSANSRMDVMSDEVTTEGFEIVFRTWGDTRVARVRADWIAIGEVAHADDWDLSG
jgi:H-type lectin domain